MVCQDLTEVRQGFKYLNPEVQFSYIRYHPPKKESVIKSDSDSEEYSMICQDLTEVIQGFNYPYP